jgi:membrane dipeptidase
MIIDAKIIPAWERPIFEDLNARAVTAVSVVCSTWENFDSSLENLRTLRRFVSDNDDILYHAWNVMDIDKGLLTGKTGVIFSWQNSTGFGDDPSNVRIFSELGLRIVQPTFITRNSAGSGCYEGSDQGLTNYGRELVLALNQANIAIDLAHVGDRTAHDVIKVSSAPVFYSQTSPRALKNSVRNKTDEDMRAVADGGGIICLTTLKQHLPSGLNSTVDDMADTVAYVMNIVGEDSIGIGTDLIPGQSRKFLDFVSHEGGTGRKVMDYTVGPEIKGFEDFRGYENLRRLLAKKGVSNVAVDKFMGLNLRRFFSDVWTRTNSVSDNNQGTCFSVRARSDRMK